MSVPISADPLLYFGSYLLEEVATAPTADLLSKLVDNHVPHPLGGSERDDDDDGRDDGGPETVCNLIDSRGRISHVAHMNARAARPCPWLHKLPQL